MPRSEDGITAPETDAQRFARVVRARKAPKTQNRYANLAGHFLRYVTLYFEDFIESENHNANRPFQLANNWPFGQQLGKVLLANYCW